ncbi:MAG: diguanylate cyclase domain-containing protein [Velocimicrobium sp.]
MNKKILNRILYGTVDQSFYKMNWQTIDDINYKTIKTVYMAATTITFLLTVFTVSYKFLNYITVFYIGYTLFFAIMTGITFYLSKRKHQVVKILYYTFALAMYALVIVVGTVFSPQNLAVTFYVVLCIIPVIYIEPPINSILLTSFACVCFGITTYYSKADYPTIVQYDIANIVCCFVIIVIFIAFIRNMMLGYMKQIFNYEAEAQLDKLTGFLNKEYTQRQCVNYIDKKIMQQSCTLMLIEVDNFKQINNIIGDRQGDYILCEVAGVLRKVFDENDILGRFGGDEFLVFIKGLGDKESIAYKADLISRRVRTILSDIIKNGLSCSIGIRSNDSQLALDFDTMLSQASQALTIARKKGVGNLEFYIKEDNTDKPLILVVDEVKISRAVLCNFLKSEYDAIPAEDAKMAIQYLRLHKDKVAAILIDTSVPITNGYDVIGEIRKNENYKNIAIIKITSNQKKGIKIMEVGVNEFVSRPYEINEVRNKVSDAIKKKGNI